MATVHGTSRGATHRSVRSSTPIRPAAPPGSRESAESGESDNSALDMRRPAVTDIWRAQEIIRPHITHTPILASRTLGAMTGAKVFLKAENMQRSGAYKIRGATYKLSQLSDDERVHGVIAASAGNHAQGVAIAAATLHVPCTIVMPTTAPLAKVTATQGYGASMVLYGDTYNDAYEHAVKLAGQSGATYIEAFNDPDIIAGQGTIGLEILADLPDVEAVVVSVGGGGLISASLPRSKRSSRRFASSAYRLEELLQCGRPLTLGTW